MYRVAFCQHSFVVLIILALILSVALACGRIADPGPCHQGDWNWSNTDVGYVITALEAAGDVGEKDSDGRTLLHWFARCNEESLIIEWLLDHGAEINEKDDNGQTPLHYAAEFNEEPSVIEVLLERGADVNAKENDHRPGEWAFVYGRTPLQLVPFPARFVDTGKLPLTLDSCLRGND